MKKILFSFMIIAAAAAVVIGGTTAYFSDTETSTGNTFTAGAIDLEISSHYSDYSGEYGFESTNLDGTTLFTFDDMKPGDMGGGYFDVIGESNPYWACVKSEVDTQPENGVLESETGDTPDDGDQDGELQNYLSFYFWNDLNGDGEYTPGDIAQDRNLYGPVTLAELEAAGYLPLADATGVDGPSFLSGSPLAAGVEYNLGYKFCFGTWGIDPATNGLSCTGEGDQNIAQTDGVSGSMEFYAVQSRNNMEFVCSDLNPVFVLIDQDGYNDVNKNSGFPYVDWVINGGEIEFTFVNPTGITQPFYFDYRVDDESGAPVSGVTGVTIPSGRLANDVWGDFYNFVSVGPGVTKTIVVSGNEKIQVRLMLGPERDYDFDWITFETL